LEKPKKSKKKRRRHPNASYIGIYVYDILDRVTAYIEIHWQRRPNPVCGVHYVSIITNL